MSATDWTSEEARLLAHQSFDLVQASAMQAVSVANFLYDVALADRFGQELVEEARTWEEGKGEPGSKLRRAYDLVAEASSYLAFVQTIASHRSRPN